MFRDSIELRINTSRFYALAACLRRHITFSGWNLFFERSRALSDLMPRMAISIWLIFSKV